MKKAIIILLVSFQSIIAVAQESYIKNADKEQNYLNLKKFLIDQKFNSRLFQQQLGQWITLTRKKEFASAVQVDSRYVIQTMPLNYSSKDLNWISPAKKYSYRDSYQYLNSSFGEQVAQDIINDIGTGIIKKAGKSKYRYSAANNSKPYNSPSFLKF